VRVTGDTAWLEKKDWKNFCEYEEGLNESVADQCLAVLCTYPLAACGSGEILDVVRTHQFPVAKRNGGWDVVETAGHKQATEEGLTNIAKHSKAGSAQVHVTGEPDGIHLTVEDAGTGFDVERLESKAGLGLVSMHERVRLVHGTIRVDSAPARGTRIDTMSPARTERATSH
jgi:MEDS: MEthanogen/methylotroph, DcmR Sensory domain/Histidine kinase-, DNA gyrase B-, and HSP90-like ATPase